MKAASWPSRLRPRTGSPSAYVWECGLLPAPSPEDCPPAPPLEASRGKPRQRRFPGKYLVYTDASAIRPKDPYLRRAACAFWVGDSKSDSAAWSLPGPVQTVYRAEVALEIFRGEVDVASDCKRFVDDAERIGAGGRVSPTSRHADSWFRYKNALSAEGLGRVLVRWVPSHEKEHSNRISPEDRNRNDQADRLANALAKRIGPTARQGKLYDRMVRQMAAIQGIQLKILTASQASDPPRTQDRAQRGPGAARGRSNGPPRPRTCHPPTLEPGELRVWGPHLIAPHGTEGYRCITCAKVANHKKARYALKYLPCSGRCGLGGPPGHADPGSNGTERTKPDGGAKGRAATRPPSTTPPNTTADGSA